MVNVIGNSGNLNIGVGRDQGPISQSQQSALALKGRGIPDGALVEGRVLSAQEGAYMVRIAGQNMFARSNLSLFPGQHFQAIWDAKGEVPLLRLRMEDAALLGRLPKGDQEAAALLLSKGLPVTDEFLLALRREIRRMDGDAKMMNALIELMARGERVSPEKAGILTWYMSMDAEAVAHQWRRIQRELRERGRKGENPLVSLKEMRDGDGETSRFLQAHSILSKAAREEFSNASLSGSWWPASEDGSIPARVRFSSSGSKKGERKFYRVDFSVEGVSLGMVDGSLETDGRSMAISLRAESGRAEKVLADGLPSLRKELDGGALAVQYLGINKRNRPIPGVYLRLDVEA